MSKVSGKDIRNYNKFRKRHRYLCQAPWVSIKISMDGLVSPCCYNVALNDHYSGKTLKTIWEGEVFTQYRDSIKKNLLPDACEKCENSILNKEYRSVKINQYDSFSIKRARKPKPQLIELALSNICNLECVMCSGANSSAIRRNRENLPPLKPLFDEKFRDDFYGFIPDLKEVVFAGGEPFLISVYFNIWEDIIRINPKCEMSVVTNGTILTDKVRDILERGNFRINLSFDAITKETYEKIRVNANFEQTMQNMEYFAELSRSKMRRLHLPVCPLRQNRYELPELVRFCNERDYSLNFVSVFRDVNNAMWGMSHEELSEILQYYKGQEFVRADENSLNNISQFHDLISRIEKWGNEAKSRKNFKELFDLKRDKIDILSKELFNYIDRGLEKLIADRDDIIVKREIISSRFKALIDSLPDYFDSNHFYIQLLGYSNVAIIDVLLNHSMESMTDIAEECFFYSENYKRDKGIIN